MPLLLILLVVILLLAWGYALAASPPPPHSPLSWEGLHLLGPVMIVALLGGLVAFISKVRAGATRMFNFTEFVGDMFTAAVTGVFFYWLCRGFDFNEWVTAAIVGIAGHAGSRGLFMLEKWTEAKLESLKIGK